MKCFYIIGVICLCAFELNAQVDTIDASKQLKKAPADLEKVLLNIQQDNAKETGEDAVLEIDGLLIDNTRSKNGNEFYGYFYRDWIAPPQASNYSVFISERPYRLSTTMIEIRINETLVFQSFLQPRSDAVEELAKQAVARTMMYLRNYEEIVRQLDGGDRSGTGIY